MALVGKGLTFDSGGYNLKVGGMIEMMKFDKGGACAVLGAAYAISQIQPADAEVSLSPTTTSPPPFFGFTLFLEDSISSWLGVRGWNDALNFDKGFPMLGPAYAMS